MNTDGSSAWTTVGLAPFRGKVKMRPRSSARKWRL